VSVAKSFIGDIHLECRATQSNFLPVGNRIISWRPQVCPVSEGALCHKATQPALCQRGTMSPCVRGALCHKATQPALCQRVHYVTLCQRVHYVTRLHNLPCVRGALCHKATQPALCQRGTMSPCVRGCTMSQGYTACPVSEGALCHKATQPALCQRVQYFTRLHNLPKVIDIAGVDLLCHQKKRLVHVVSLSYRNLDTDNCSQEKTTSYMNIDKEGSLRSFLFFVHLS